MSVDLKKTLLILPLLFWLGCGDDYESGDTGWRHPFAGTWKVTDYCVYESANCDSNCNNQEFIPIFFQGGILNSTYRWSYLIEGRVITIDENGYFDNSTSISNSSGSRFTVGTDGYSWESFPGVGGSVPGSEYFSGTYILNDDNNTLELIYYKNSVCIRSTSEDWDGSVWMAGSDSIECYNYYGSDMWYPTDWDSTYYYETWVPEYCAKITLTKQ